MSLYQSEKYVQRLFQEKYGLNLIKIDELDSDGKTADFEFMENGKRIFICELKNFVQVEPSEKNGWELTYHQDGSVESTGTSNAINRISTLVSGNINRSVGNLECVEP